MKKENRTKKLLSLLLTFCVLTTLTACGASSAMPESSYDSMDVNMSSPSYSAGLGSIFESDSKNMMSDIQVEEAPREPSSETSAEESENQTDDYLTSQKLIYTANIEIESLEFAKSQEEINQLISKYNGFVESNYVYDNARNWYYDSYEKTHGTLVQELTVRIPSAQYHDFVNGISAIGKVLNKSENVQNITTQYNDVATTIKSLQIQEKRLLAMLEACTSIEDMITVERRLSEVQSQLERYKTQMNRYDADIQFSTITIRLEEVKQYTPIYDETNFFERLTEHLDTTIEDFAAFLEGALFVSIYLAPYGLIIALIVCIICKAVKKSKKKRMQKILNNNHANVPAPVVAEGEKNKDISVQAEVGSKKKDKK